MMVRTPSGASATREAIAKRAGTSETMQAKPPREHQNRKSVVTLLSAIAALTLCAFQFGDRNELNKMPFDQVQALVSNLAKARSLAKQGNIDLLVGQVEPGRTVSM